MFNGCQRDVTLAIRHIGANLYGRQFRLYCSLNVTFINIFAILFLVYNKQKISSEKHIGFISAFVMMIWFLSCIKLPVPNTGWLTSEDHLDRVLVVRHDSNKTYGQKCKFCYGNRGSIVLWSCLCSLPIGNDGQLRHLHIPWRVLLQVSGVCVSVSPQPHKSHHVLYFWRYMVPLIDKKNDLLIQTLS